MEGSGGKDEFVFCGACGTRLGARLRFCTSCGASQAQFAESGGGTSEAADPTPAPADEPTGETAASAPTEAMPAQDAGGQGPPTPPPPGAGAAPGAGPSGERPFIESLFDIKFEHLITPKLVRFFYALSIVILGVGALVVILAGFAADGASGAILLFLAPLFALFYLITIRLWLELIVVAFKIRDGIERLVENTERGA